MNKKIDIDPQELANISRRSILGTSMGLGAIAAAEQLGRRDRAQAHRGAQDGAAADVGQLLRIDVDLLVHFHPS